MIKVFICYINIVIRFAFASRKLLYLHKIILVMALLIKFTFSLMDKHMLKHIFKEVNVFSEKSVLNFNLRHFLMYLEAYKTFNTSKVH